MATEILFTIPTKPAGVVNQSRSDAEVGDVVTISSEDPGAVEVVEMLSRPVGSSAVLSSATPPCTFEVDKVFGYRIKLTVDGVDVKRTVSAPTVVLGLDTPAHNERASEKATIADTAYVAESESNEGPDDETKQKGYAPKMEANFTAIEADAVLNATHRSSDGKDHSDVVLNNTHRGRTDDPHEVSKVQVGLGNVDNVKQLAYGGNQWPDFVLVAPDNADHILVEDSSDTNEKKRVNMQTLLEAAKDATAIHTDGANEITGIAAKTSPAKDDVIVIENAAGVKNKVAVGNLPGDKLQFDTAYSPATEVEGEVNWNSDEGTLNIVGDGTSLQVGFEDVTKVYNNSGALIPNGSPVYLDQTVGGYPTIGLAKSDVYNTVRGMRVATQDIPNLSHGRVTQRGRVRGVDTSGFIEGVPLWVSPDTAGGYTNTRPEFPDYGIFIGVSSVIHATEGVIDVELGSDIRDTFNAFHNGTFREPFKFNITSNGTVITGTLTPRNGHPDMTMLWSSGFAMMDTDPGATVVLTAGTDPIPQTNYVYVLESDSPRVLVVSTSDWPEEEHIKVAEVVVQTATSVATYGALRNQNWNDEIQDTVAGFYQGHLSHICENIRSGPAKWKSGTEGTLAISGTPNDVYVAATAGKVLQMHKQTFPAKDTSGTDFISIINRYPQAADAYTEVQNLNGEITDANGDSLTNKHFSFVLMGVINSAGDPSRLMLNLPTGSYISAATAEADLNNYTVYDIPEQFQGVGFLIARFNLQLNAAGTVWTLNSTQDLRGKIPNTTAGGGGGGGGTGATTFDALTDTPSTKVALSLVRAAAGGTALEYVATTVDLFNQYVLVDGTRAMSGDLQMGGNAITGVGLVDGVDVSAHGPLHEDGGADEIDVTGLSGVLADLQDPAIHGASSHSGTIGTATQVGLGSVTNDAQLKRSENDWAGFSTKSAAAATDAFLIEDSEDATVGAKKRVLVSQLPGGVDTTAIHKATAAEISPMTDIGTPAATDVLVIEDASDSYNKKKVQASEFLGGAGSDQVKVSSDDTTAGYLEDKIDVNNQLGIEVENDGGNENILICGLGVGASSYVEYKTSSRSLRLNEPADITAAQTTIVVDEQTSPTSTAIDALYLSDGDGLWIEDELMQVDGTPTSTTSITVIRGVAGTTAATHSDGTALNPTTILTSSYQPISADGAILTTANNYFADFKTPIFLAESINNTTNPVTFDITGTIFPHEVDTMRPTSAVFASGGSTITVSGVDATDYLSADDLLTVTGTTSNDGVYRITNVTATVITCSREAFISETAGSSVMSNGPEVKMDNRTMMILETPKVVLSGNMFSTSSPVTFTVVGDLTEFSIGDIVVFDSGYNTEEFMTITNIVGQDITATRPGTAYTHFGSDIHLMRIKMYRTGTKSAHTSGARIENFSSSLMAMTAGGSYQYAYKIPFIVSGGTAKISFALQQERDDVSWGTVAYSTDVTVNETFPNNGAEIIRFGDDPSYYYHRLVAKVETISGSPEVAFSKYETAKLTLIKLSSAVGDWF